MKNKKGKKSNTMFQRGIHKMVMDYGVLIENSVSVEQDFGRGNNLSSVTVVYIL